MGPRRARTGCFAAGALPVVSAVTGNSCRARRRRVPSTVPPPPPGWRRGFLESARSSSLAPGKPPAPVRPLTRSPLPCQYPELWAARPAFSLGKLPRPPAALAKCRCVCACCFTSTFGRRNRGRGWISSSPGARVLLQGSWVAGFRPAVQCKPRAGAAEGGAGAGPTYHSGSLST